MLYSQHQLKFVSLYCILYSFFFDDMMWFNDFGLWCLYYFFLKLHIIGSMLFADLILWKLYKYAVCNIFFIAAKHIFTFSFPFLCLSEGGRENFWFLCGTYKSVVSSILKEGPYEQNISSLSLAQGSTAGTLIQNLVSAHWHFAHLQPLVHLLSLCAH